MQVALREDLGAWLGNLISVSVQIVPGLVLALMIAPRTTDKVHCINRAFAVSEIAKKKNLGLALLAGSYDVPGSTLGFERHRGHFFLPEIIWRRQKP